MALGTANQSPQQEQSMNKAQIGIYGLGTMGSALALNMADHGFEVAVTNRDTSWIADFIEEADDLSGNLHAEFTLADFVNSLQTPRIILFMIPSGKPMDMLIEKITPLLDAGDTIIDGGNADFHDTRARSIELAKSDLHFVGMGVSGGEEGARFGPSIMVGGTAHSWEQLKDILRAIAADFNGVPCADHLGPDGAGHFVKTVHNGIEYADMQMIAEVYGIMRDGRGNTPAEIGAMFERWNKGALKSYLVEITGKVLAATDPVTGKPMVDVIVDSAGQKGTGRWTVIEALTLGQSASTIEAAVAARSWSAAKETRVAGQDILAAGATATGGSALTEEILESALLAAKIIAYGQGFALLEAASQTYDWNIDMARIAEVWRAGCIIRSDMLDDMAAAARAGLPHGQLIFAPGFRDQVVKGSAALRRVVAAAALQGLPVPAFSAALAYYDTMGRGRGTTDLIQGQRDFFGAHGFERVDGGADQHGPWAMA